jgi:AraC-like DNA-binding protein
MRYDLFEPLPALQQDIHAFWVQEKTSTSFDRQILFPDSYVELIIQIGSSCIWELETGEQIEVPHANIVGLQKGPLRVRTANDFHAIGIHLFAWGARALVGKQINLDAPYTPLDSRWQNFARELEWTTHRYGYAGAVEQLQQYVSEMYCRASVDTAVVRTAGKLLHETHGQLGIHDLADQCYLSASQLQRRFKDLIGISPKTYARLIRFEAVRDRLLDNPAYPVIDLAGEFGFADQAHFIRDFKAFTSQTPRPFAAYAHTGR